MLPNYLYNCGKITEITKINTCLYIAYDTVDGKEVSLCYSDGSLLDKIVYDESKDVAFVESRGTATLQTHFRQGASYEMTDALLDQIYSCVQAEDWDALRRIDDIVVDIDSDGIITIDSIYAPGQTRENGFTSDAQMLSHLKSKWTPYTNVSKNSYSLYASNIAKYVGINVTESRNAYAKKTASWWSFVVGTTISAIANKLGLSSSAVVNVLNAIGIGLSVTSQITSAVTLSRSAVYRYWGERRGYAYDTYTYNKYVRVIMPGAYGEYTGGYLSNGTFNWVESTRPSVYNKTYRENADQTLYNYSNCIAVYGYCAMYSPD